MKASYDLAIIGSGFAGSLLAMIAARLNLSVALLESGRHPRFAIGESSTPLANLLLEQLASRYDLPAIAPLAKWGTWQATYPDIACGLKRGFSFLHHTKGQKSSFRETREKQLLVAASPHNKVADVHWYRSELDHLLVRQAEAIGVEFFDQLKLDSAREQIDCLELGGSRDGGKFEIRAKFVVDASGPRGFLHRALSLPEVQLPRFPGTQALYSHFTHVGRIDEQIAHGDAQPPFPIDDAAVHHVFDGGWIWVLRLNNGITSAGVCALDAVAKRLEFKAGAAAWNRLMEELPSVREQFINAQPVRAFTHAPKVAFRSERITGERWALMPSAAGFVDPLLSTGFPLTLLGIQRLAGLFESSWGSRDWQPKLSQYACQTDKELLAASQLIGALYANMGRFDRFSDLTLLYFAAASYTETVLRMGKSNLSTSFLLFDHPEFGPKSRQLLERAMQDLCSCDNARFHTDLLAAIEPINVAGLGNEQRHNWYPVDAEDLLAAAGKLNATRDEITTLLDRAGFWE